MRLVDVMSGARLEVFAEIGLVIFALAFAAVLVTTLLGRNRAPFERAARLPLDEGAEPAHVPIAKAQS